MYTGSISAKKLGANVNAAAVPMIYGMDVDDAGDELDATVGEDLGYGDTDVGVKQATFTLRLLVDVVSGASTSFTPGTQLTNFAMYYDRTGAAVITAAKVIVTNARRTGEVRGRWEMTVAFKTRGAYTIAG